MINKDVRKRIIIKGAEMGSSHFSSAFSCVDAIKYLFDYLILPEKDIFILSKGHGEMALFAVLESRGQAPFWTVHLEYCEDNGVYATSGSLGHGLPIALGRALGKAINNRDGHVYVLVGDGELEEGSNWEALTIAHRLKLSNLTILVDWNKHQATGSTFDTASIDAETIEKRLSAFGCNVIRVNGHDMVELKKIALLPTGLNAVVLDTVKGRGFSFLEKNNLHSFSFAGKPELYLQALKELS